MKSLDSSIMLLTPEKTNESSNAKLKKIGVKHLDIYNAMVELFGAMTRSLRLLGLCKKPQTFRNISKQVEALIKRKFSIRDLGQIKYILPEAIQINSYIVHEKKTLCMEPDLKIALIFAVIKGHSEQSDYVALRQVFDYRLVNFFTAHPEADDIPEATLPEPFSQNSQAFLRKLEAECLEAVASGGRNCQTIDFEQSPLESTESLTNSADTELLTTSLLDPAFSPHFSQKTVAVAPQKTKSITYPASASSPTSDQLINQTVKTCQAEASPADLVKKKGVKKEQQMKLPDTCSKSTVVNRSFQQLMSECVGSHACESPLQKLASPADILTVETPAKVTPRRSMPSCDNKLKAMTTQDRTSCYKTAKRSIDFSHLEGEGSALDSLGTRRDSYSVSGDEISQDVEAEVSEEGSDIVSRMILEKSQGSLGDLSDDCKMRQSEPVFNKDLSVFLPDLVTSIHNVFRTVNCSSITKQELVHKIIMNNLDIIERREVEEQIGLLEKLVPEWICMKLGPGGDIMYSIKKVLDLTSIQARVRST